MMIQRSTPKVLAIVRILVLAATLFVVEPILAQRQMERLGRGLVALRTASNTVFLSWRVLGTEPESTGFHVYRITGTTTNRLTSSPITNVTCYLDTGANLTLTNIYIVRPVIEGIETNPVGTFVITPNYPIRDYIPVPLDIPPGGVTPDGVTYTYSANDASVGDLDGDGEYEIVLKWDPSNSKDNSQSGYTGPVYIDAYKLSGQRLWRINLGINIRAGAHYTQFMVYDLDGDGRAEMVCKTAPGTIDGVGNFVIMPGDNPYADYRNSSGYILSGPEYLTVFDGYTGAALWTTNYIPPRGNVSSWGDSYGNRVDRFLACVAYLDGVRPSVVMCRGYYTRAVLAAWDWRNGVLRLRWVFDTWNGYSSYEGQGNHNLSVGDVDGDGKDEIVYGACAIDHDGRGLYTTGLGHGDAMHLSDMDLDFPGLEVWDVHEVPSQYGAGEFRDAGTGTIYWGLPSTDDTGRGCAAPLLNSYLGYLCWSSASGGLYNSKGQYVGTSPSSCNFLVYWDADLARELLDGITISKYGAGTLLTASGCSANNGSKATPCLSGDILGDWREEVIWRSSDNAELRIYTPTTMATNRFYTLMHDPQYRLAIAWQNVAYNQPPHPGFYLGPGMDLAPLPLISAAHLVWRGSHTNNVWDSGGNLNWRSNYWWLPNYWYGPDAPQAPFTNNVTVLFDMTGTNSLPVTIASVVQPSKIFVHSPFNYVFAGAGTISGTAELWKADRGTLTILNTNTYVGTTHVRGGTLAIDGLLTASRVITRGRGVWGPATVAGFGRLGNGLVLVNGAAVAPGRDGQPGTIYIQGSVHITNALLLIDLSNDPSGTQRTNDLISIAGPIYVGGTNTIRIRAIDNSLGVGQYELMRFTTGIVGGAGNWKVEGIGNIPYQLLLLNTSIVLKVLPSNRSLVWRGDGVSNVWNRWFSSNWISSTGERTFFIDGDETIFDDTGSNNVPVNIVETVMPSSVRITNASTYRFAGVGGIAGTNTWLLKSGAGTLIISNANSYRGGTFIESGTIQLGNTAANMNALGTGPITFLGGTLRFHGFGSSSTGTDWGGHTNTWIVPTGYVGTVLMPPRFGWGQPFTSSLKGGGKLHIVTDYVRCSFGGDWSQFYGVIRVGPRTTWADFRLNNPAGLPNARLYLSNGITAYNVWGDNAVIDIGALDGDSGAVLGPGNGSSANPTWRIGWRNEDSDFKGSIRDAGTTSLIKVGKGTLRLSGTNSYSGTTTVQDGTLCINGDNSMATNVISVATTGTLSGKGIVGGPILVTGTLSPGDNAPGTLTCLKEVIFSNTACLRIEIETPHTYDAIVSSNRVICSGTLFITNIGSGVLPGRYRIIRSPQITGAFANIVLPPLDPSCAWYLGELYTRGTIVVYRRPSLTVEANASTLQISADGLPTGARCRLLSTTNLHVPLYSWVVLSEAIVGENGYIAFTNTINTNDIRFFAIQIPE